RFSCGRKCACDRLFDGCSQLPLVQVPNLHSVWRSPARRYTFQIRGNYNTPRRAPAKRNDCTFVASDRVQQPNLKTVCDRQSLSVSRKCEDIYDPILHQFSLPSRCDFNGVCPHASSDERLPIRGECECSDCSLEAREHCFFFARICVQESCQTINTEV